MKFWLALIAVVAVLFGGLTAFAGGEGCSGAAAEAKADGKSGDCAKKCATAKASCEVRGKKVEYDVPAMTYKVGDKETCCEKMALEAAKGEEKAVKFIVAGKSFDTKSEAMTAYAETLDNYLNNQVLTVRYAVGDECVACPMAAGALAKSKNEKMKYRLASFNFDDQEKADKALAAAKKAIDGGCKAGEAKGCCAAKAEAKGESKDGEVKKVADAKEGQPAGCTGHAKDAEAKGCGATKEGQVAKASDEKKIGCCKEAEGKVEVARAKIDAAIKAIAEVAGA